MDMLYEKHKEMISYLFFGICTTLVNIIVYLIAAHSLNQNVLLSTILAWILAVLFAYVTNRKWVFHSNVKTKILIIKELNSFVVCRFATGVIDWLCMYIFAYLLTINDVAVKVTSNVLVIFLNYIASKLVIFKKGKQ